MRKGFVFDLDGVITDTAKFHYLAWKNLASKLSIELTPEFNEKLKGISRMESLEKILELGNQQNQYTMEEKKELAEEKNKEYLKLLADLGPRDVLPGVQKFLEDAHKLNVPCAIASASKNAPYILEKLNIENYFEYIVDPSKLKNGKPDPEIFIVAAKHIGFDPQECIGFEDSPAGILGINDAGMFSVGISETDSLEKSNLHVTSFESLNINDLLNE